MEINKDKTDHEDEKGSNRNSMQILEEGLVICKFGKFHLRLMFATLNAVLAANLVTTTSSYILPNAECDLHMTIMQKGWLNAMPFFGQVGASLFTGFVTDAFGRKIFLVSGNIGIFICCILEGSSQTYWMLLIGKLFGGIFVSFCYGATAAMVSEFFHKDIRDRVMMFYASLMSLSLVIIALLSWAILPRQWNYVIVEGYFEIHTWNIYLYVCSMWSVMAGVSYYYLPESPKWLLSHGQENEALEVLKDIYRINTGLDKEKFPIKSLNITGEYIPTNKDSLKKQLVDGLFEVKTLFRRPLSLRLIQFSAMTFVCLLAYSALRLWFPQISTIVENYKLNHNETQRFCVMINEYTQGLVKINPISNITEPEVCIPQVSGTETYINGIILGLVSLICISLSGYLVPFVGQKPLMFVLLILCAVGSGCLYWTNSSIQIALLLSITCGLVQAALSLQQSILVRVFPTTLRTLTLSIIVMVGRIGSLLGNVLFPVMLQSGCMTPFLIMSGINLGVASIVYFLPNPNKDNAASGDK